MSEQQLTPTLWVSAQIGPDRVSALAEQGFTDVICNRPDGETEGQPPFEAIRRAAETVGIRAHYLPVVPGQFGRAEAARMAALLASAPGKTLAYCRTGNRSASLWAVDQWLGGADKAALMSQVQTLGFDLGPTLERFSPTTTEQRDILVVGGGAAGIAVAASIKARQSAVGITIVEPASNHFYQPGWTLVGGGVFSPEKTRRDMASIIPPGVEWIQSAVTAFAPEDNRVTLSDGRTLQYQQLVVAPGLVLNWSAIEGLEDTLGKNGVTSNYRYDLAPYTWALVKGLKGGRAVFTQPPMPIKCAGAPQKAMYLSADYWLSESLLSDISVGFYNAGAVLFGVSEYVPALMEYVRRYNIDLNFQHNLVAVDGPRQIATFVVTNAEGESHREQVPFEMLHVCPPQSAPAFVRHSALADKAGWVDVNPATLQHQRYGNVWALGDVINAPNAKTAAAARAQAPIVATNLLAAIGYHCEPRHYNGYGSCPLTVERGKIVLAEFGYGGKLLPSFPPWLLDGTRPTRLAWWLKERILPPVYWQAMLKGREWLTQSEPATREESTH